MISGFSAGYFEFFRILRNIFDKNPFFQNRIQRQCLFTENNAKRCILQNYAILTVGMLKNKK